MSWQETAYTSPRWWAIPPLGKGTLGTWRFHRAARRSDTELAQSRRGNGTRLWANRGSRGVCEPALQPRQAGKAHGRKARASNRTREIRQSGIIGGGLGKRGHGGIVNPPRNRKGEAGNPPPVSWRARSLSRLWTRGGTIASCSFTPRLLQRVLSFTRCLPEHFAGTARAGQRVALILMTGNFNDCAVRFAPVSGALMREHLLCIVPMEPGDGARAFLIGIGRTVV